MKTTEQRAAANKFVKKMRILRKKFRLSIWVEELRPRFRSKNCRVWRKVLKTLEFI